MSSYTGLQKRHNTYYYRVRVPIDLQQALKKKEIVVSLKTVRKDEAVSRLKTEALKAQQRFNRLRAEQEAEQTNQSLAPDLSWEDCEVITCNLLYEASVKDKDNRILNSKYYTKTEDIQNYSPELFDYCMGLVEDRRYYPQDSISRLRFEHTYLRHYSTLHKIQLQRDSDNYTSDFPKPDKQIQKSFTTKPQTGIHESIRLTSLLEMFKKAPERIYLSKTSINNYQIAVKMLLDLAGEDIYIHNITRQLCKDFVSMLLEIPSNGKAQLGKDKTYPQLVEENTTALLPTLAIGSIKLYLTGIKTLLKWATEEELIDKNVALGIKIPINRKVADKDKRLPFSDKQLNTIFSQSTREEHCISPSKYWIPLLSLYTGFRLNECCQLTKSDIKNKAGIYYLELLHEDKKLKTSNSSRILPIHSELIRCGLLKYADSLADDSKLFPDLTVAYTGDASTNYSKWFRRTLQAIDAKTPKTSFHSFRHNFRDALRNAQIPRDIAQVLGGWEGDGKTDLIYGSGYSVEVLNEHLSKIKYDGLDLEHLYES